MGYKGHLTEPGTHPVGFEKGIGSVNLAWSVEGEKIGSAPGYDNIRYCKRYLNFLKECGYPHSTLNVEIGKKYVAWCSGQLVGRRQASGGSRGASAVKVENRSI